MPEAPPVVADPFPAGAAERYRFDLARLFFPTPDAAARDRARVLAALAAFRRAGDAGLGTADALLAAMRGADSLTGAVARHAAYLSLRTALDARDADAQSALDALDASAAGATAWLGPALIALDDRTLARFTAARPALAGYAYAIRSARRTRAHVVSAAEARVVGALAPEVTGWQPRLFQAILASTPYPPVPTPDGPRDLRRDGNTLRASPDRAVRAAAARVGREAQASRRDLFAFTLARTVGARNAAARLRRYPDFPAESYDERSLTPDGVRATLAQLAAAADVNRRFERAQAAWVRRVAGYDTVHTWDLTMPEPGAAAPRFTIDDASRAVRAATAPLGAEYAREMAALLDPANGRLDLVPRPGRVDRPGFSTGSVGYPSTFFQGRFEGYLPDVIILAHEGGHAVQNMLMTASGVRPLYAAGPAYFTESFAGLNELLVTDHLYRTTADPGRRRAYLRQWLEQATEVFKTAREAAFEQAVYDSAAAGRPVTTADGFEAVMQREGASYSQWFGDGAPGGGAADAATTSFRLARGERTMEWVNALQFYTRPLYRVNYVYAKLLALAYFDRLEREGPRFGAAYGALLRRGYDADPDQLLRGTIGTGLGDPALVRGAASLIARRVAEYERLTAPR